MREEAKWIVVAWLPHFTGTLSLLGSSAVICMIISDRAEKLAKPNHRLMLMLSAFDVLQSTAVAMSTWPFPRTDDIYGSMGNIATCKVQYFFATLGLAVPMYNASLCLLYLLTIKYRLHPRHFATKIEPFLHIASVLYPLTLASVPVAMNDVIAPRYDTICSINQYSPVAWPFVVVPLLSLLVCLYSMVAICCYVKAQSDKMKKYSHGRSQIQRRESEKRATIRQAIYYTGAFVITFLFPAARKFFPDFYLFAILKNVFYPLQGFWNFLLYIRPSVIKMKETEQDKCVCCIIWRVVFYPQEKKENVKQKRRSTRKKIPTQADIIKANLDNERNMINEWSSVKSEESKEEIAANMIIMPKKDHITQNIENEDQVGNYLEDIDHAPGSIPKRQSRRFSSSINCTGYELPVIELGISNERMDEGVVRRASLVFATVDDNISCYSLDSQESTDE